MSKFSYDLSPLGIVLRGFLLQFKGLVSYFSIFLVFRRIHLARFIV